jgi:hypothetical protein
LALFALAVQLVLSFGHLHGLALASAKAAVTTAGTDATSTQPQLPARKSDGRTDLYCPICASIQSAAVSVPSAPPTLPLPANVGGVRLDGAAEFAAAIPPRLLFRARAPPSV